MEKFKATVISKEFITSASDALITQNALVFNDGVGSSTILNDDQANNNNYKNSQTISRDVPATVTGYKNLDTNTIVANVKMDNRTLSNDVKISTVLIYASYNNNNILVATARTNSPELLPAFDADKGTPVTIEFSVYMQVTSVINAPVQFNSAGLATNTDLMRVDNSAVHKTGNETTTGVKTFTQTIVGSITGNAGTATKLQTARRIGGQPFDGTSDVNLPGVNATGNQDTTGNAASADVFNTRQAPFTDFNDLAKNLPSYQGRWRGGYDKIANSPEIGWFIADIIIWGDTNLGYIVLHYTDHNAVWFGLASNGAINWAKVSNDSNVVHNTGTETVAGDKTFLKKIQGSITNADVADVRTNSISDNQDISKITTSGYYAGRNVSNAQGIPSANFNGKYFDLTVWVAGSNGFMFIVDDSDHMYFRKRQNSVWLDYHSMPIDDTKLVHNSGNETIYDRKTFDAVTTFNNGIVNKPISMNGVKMDFSELVSGSYNVWQNDISGCPADFGIVEVFENVSNTMYRFTETNLPDPHVWVQIKNSFGFSGWKQQM